jgi:hypothetical protein
MHAPGACMGSSEVDWGRRLSTRSDRPRGDSHWGASWRLESFVGLMEAGGGLKDALG